jgi:hypothetical protein
MDNWNWRLEDKISPIFVVGDYNISYICGGYQIGGY